jgi:putative NADPH-quinone reductase
MTRPIVIIQGHPDAAGHHLLHAMADAYSNGATAAKNEVRHIEVAKLEFPLLRTQVDFETGASPPALLQHQEDMRWAEHWVFLFPLWHGTMPALFKGFLEHIFRPGFAMDYKKQGFPKIAILIVALPFGNTCLDGNPAVDLSDHGVPPLSALRALAVL